MFVLFSFRSPIRIGFNTLRCFFIYRLSFTEGKGIKERENVSRILSVSIPRRKSSVKEVPPEDDNDEEMDTMLQNFQQQRAAKALQRQWRGYQGKKKTEREEQDRQAVERQNQAAATLQKNWRKHRDKVLEAD